ncbi:MAG: aspartate/glutamate racemase family protein, partial [Phenylobacterium sp.]|uniref:aspartate/glutamate racemase family protein n=1 Tax=Phenylobacterium sp. TaxID=1871053 RepID=UPI002732F483
QRASGLPLIDMIQTAASAAGETGARRVGVLGSRPALRLYREYLAAQSMGIVTLPAERQQAFTEAFADLKSGDISGDMGRRMAELSSELIADGAELVILGAAELTMVLSEDDVLFGVIDPAERLARRCVSVCLGLEPTPVALEG